MVSHEGTKPRSGSGVPSPRPPRLRVRHPGRVLRAGRRKLVPLGLLGPCGRRQNPSVPGPGCPNGPKRPNGHKGLIRHFCIGAVPVCCAARDALRLRPLTAAHAEPRIPRRKGRNFAGRRGERQAFGVKGAAVGRGNGGNTSLSGCVAMDFQPLAQGWRWWGRGNCVTASAGNRADAFVLPAWRRFHTVLERIFKKCSMKAVSSHHHSKGSGRSRNR